MKLIIHYYGANRLKINDEKTQIMIMKSQFKRSICITATNGDIVWNIAQMKILGIYVNPQNNYTSNIAISRSRALYRLSELQPLLKDINNFSLSLFAN